MRVQIKNDGGAASADVMIYSLAMGWLLFTYLFVKMIQKKPNKVFQYKNLKDVVLRHWTSYETTQAGLRPFKVFP